ncbi:MAG: tetratricopeptide repeat protein [Verrucomicrobiales bacterium]|nr:tetratricopeptide repeat protein [Verrucomicrobiales bacterium]
MSSAVTQTPTSDEPPQQDRLLNVLAWLEIHRNQLVAGFVGLLLVVGVVFLWRHFRSEREARANAALLELRARPDAGEDAGPKAADFLKVAEEHASTSAAPRARLLAAGAYFAENKYTEAQAEFERVLSSEGSGPLAAQAAFGVAASLDAQDKQDQAIAKYQEVINQFPEESVAAQARLALARIQESRQQSATALRLYDELVREREPGPFSQQAVSQREALLKKHPELAASTNAAPTAK